MIASSTRKETIMVTSDNPKVRKGMDLVDEMDADELSSLVDYIRMVYKSKRSMDKARAFATLREGDHVRLGNIQPLYLQGLTGVIEEKRQTRITVKLDRGPTKKFRSGSVVCTPTSLTKIES
jgi:hypothetical protein